MSTAFNVGLPRATIDGNPTTVSALVLEEKGQLPRLKLRFMGILDEPPIDVHIEMTRGELAVFTSALARLHKAMEE